MGIERLLTGRTLLGRYRVDATLGRGGMGIVYRATDTRLERVVALKVLTPFSGESAARARARARFKREALTAARFHHPNVVRIYDYGTDDELDIDLIVMELLEGRDLAQMIRESGPIPVDVAVDLVLQAARGVAAGHDAGLIHRDVKPSNLFVSESPNRQVLQVLDFGIVELVESGDTLTHLTMPGFTPNSAAYASPEQLRRDRLTPASDVFSLGVTAVELLTGERVFKSADWRDRRDIAEHVRSGLPARGVPDAVVHALVGALSFDAGERYADGAVFVASLEAAIQQDRFPTPQKSGAAPIPSDLHAATNAYGDALKSEHPSPVLVRRKVPRWMTVGMICAAVATIILTVAPRDLPVNGRETAESVLGSALLDESTRPVLSAEEIKTIIDRIRADYQRIEREAPGMERRTTALLGFTVEKSEAELYVAGSALEKVRAFYNGEHGRTISELFFRDGALVFVYSRQYAYNDTYTSSTLIDENRYYFDANRLIRWRDSPEHIVSNADARYREQERELLWFAQQALASARSGQPIVARRRG